MAPNQTFTHSKDKALTTMAEEATTTESAIVVDKPIEKFYDKATWKIGSEFEVRVSHIYDPSKMWLVINHQDLEALQLHLFDYYNKNYESFYLEPDEIRRNQHCIVYIDEAYYRGLITSIPLFRSVESQAIVFLIDFGNSVIVTFENLLRITGELRKIPQFAVRATMHQLYPYKNQVWKDTSVKGLFDVVSNGFLMAKLVRRNPVLEALEIELFLKDGANVGDLLVGMNLASRSITGFKQMLYNYQAKYVPKPNLRCLHLLPSFGAIERAEVPLSVYQSQVLKECVPFDLVYKNFYDFNEKRSLK